MRLFGTIALAIVIGACGQSAAPTPAPATNVPCGPAEVLIRHEHAHLTILIRGQIKTVPAFVGITATQICWLHTHDTSGIIHVEAGDSRTLTLGDFFAVWRQPLGATVIDGERVASGESIQVTVNQQPYTGAPEAIVLKDHEDIVLQLGPPFLTLQPFVWPPGY
ncbi:MAG TPA: hypothetical protein VF833_03865 [Gaiellaceae bacterium]